MDRPTNNRLAGLAGADFGYDQLPGEFGVDYTYPTADEVEYYVGKGMTVFRLPFLWERIQPEAYGELDPAELARLDEVVNLVIDAGAQIILNPHSYARYYDAVIGESDLEVGAFEDLWFRLASHYGTNERVIFGLMNEPAEMESELWLSDANAAIAAVRAAGADNLILVPGNDYSGAHSWEADWYGTPNSELMDDIVDPLDNFAYELHQYLDADSSGTSAECVSPTVGSERLESVTRWLADEGKQGFLGEFAAANNPTCLEALDDLVGFMGDHPDTWLGWTYWAGGPWWGDDIFAIEPSSDGLDRPQMDVLEGSLTP